MRASYVRHRHLVFFSIIVVDSFYGKCLFMIHEHTWFDFLAFHPRSFMTHLVIFAHRYLLAG